MPATSRSGERLSRRSVSGARRLALEVDDDEVVAGPQHLAEVQSPWQRMRMPRQAPPDDPRAALEDAVLGAQQALRRRRAISAGSVCCCSRSMPEHLRRPGCAATGSSERW